MSRKMNRFVGVFLVAMLFAFMVFPSAMLAAPNLDKVEKDYKLYLKSMKVDNNINKNNLSSSLSNKAYRFGEVGPYIIVFSGPIEPEMKDSVTRKGATMVEYIPDFAFLAMMTPQEATQVAGLSFVEAVEVYQPVYKIHPSLRDRFGNLNIQGEVALKISTFEDTSVLDNEIMNARGKKFGQNEGFVKVMLHRNQIEKFANMNTVKYIEEVPEFELFNDVAKGYMNVDDVWNLGYNGSGQVVGVCDTGLDTGVNNSTMHLDFQGRIDAIYALGRSTADDPHGHGTHVAGSVLGDGARSNGQLKGMAPAARMVFQSVLDSAGGLGGLPNDLNDLFSQAWNAGARIHTNSWGAPVNGDYNTNAQEVDQYVWNNDMIVLFAAGNEGCDDNWSYEIYNTISSPGSAKNCITVGASENYRSDKGQYADNPNEIVIFSSRGTTEDGRIKPDVVAPGSWILSTRSSKAADSAFWGTYNTYYAYMGGTSMATPLTAGAVAVAREYMQAEWNHTPSPAMMKAALINGAVDLGYGVPSKDQGWGRVSLVDSLSSKEYQYEDENYSLSTGQTETFAYSIESANTPLRVSLVWTDYPGSTTASKALVNDLDVKVTSPSGTVYYGNDFTSPYNSSYDRLNNVENVWINSPEVGTYTVEINGYNVPQGPQPFVLFTSANFGASSGGDTTDPTCNITAPSNGATVSNTVTFSASASDNVGVSKVEFYVDGSKVGTDTSSPYSMSWDTTTANNGSHTLQVKAYDAAGNIGSSNTISVTVDNGGGSNGTVTKEFTGYVSKTGTSSQSFYINVTAAGDIDLNLAWGNTSDLDMYLYDPSGTQVTKAYTTKNPETISYAATTTGQYEIKVTAYSGSADFTLTATYQGETSGSTTVNKEFTDSVNYYGTQTKEFYIDVTDAGDIDLNLAWSTTADLDMYLYNPSGTQVAKAYTTKNPETISYAATTTGQYKIVVDAYSGSASFTLTATYQGNQ